MQSRVALAYTAARRSFWNLSQRGLCSATRSRTADPQVHSGELEAGPDVHQEPPQGTKTTNNTRSTKFVETDHAPSKKEDPLENPKSPTEPSSKLKSTGVNQPLDPSLQQKRKQGSKASLLEEASCAAGLDVDQAPFPDENEEKIRKKQEENNRDYFKDHKASPLSELEVADTRREVGSSDVIGWLPEQLDTAEDSLRRATEIWRQNAIRGDPDAPHSRILRQLRGEDF